VYSAESTNVKYSSGILDMCLVWEEPML
jgi:hypothetical protein